MSEVGTSMKALHLTVGSLVYFTYFSSAEAWGPKVSFRSFLSSPQSRKCSSLSLAQSSEVIGSGRIGAFLAEAGDCTILGRNDVIDPNQPGNPILIATRNDALEGIVDSCPKSRRGDLVFLQNGYLDDFLASKDLMNNTQVLLYLSVPTKGATPVDGVTKVNPEGLTAATGIHANAFADRVAALGMKCKTVSTADYRPAMFEKLM